MTQVRAVPEEHEPDVLCLQETKCPNDQFPVDGFRALGYEHIAIHGQKGYHGVATLSQASRSTTWCGRISAPIGDARHLSMRLTRRRAADPDPQFLRAGRRRRARSRRSTRNSSHKLDFIEEMRRDSAPTPNPASRAARRRSQHRAARDRRLVAQAIAEGRLAHAGRDRGAADAVWQDGWPT